MDTSIQPTTFADLLQHYRRTAGLTQAELAERAHLSVRGISNLERGVRRLPQRGTVALLSEALGLQGVERAAFDAAARGLIAPAGREPTAGAPSPAAVTALPLVGRVQELTLLARHLRGEGPPVLLLAGEPGIGKSRLLQEAQEQAAGLGWTVTQGGCRRRGGQEPYAPILEALERSLRALSPAQLRTALQGCAWLVRLLPELAVESIEPLPAWTLSPNQERRLMFKAVSRFLANVAGPAGTLLILDDLQWAGADALDLLTALVPMAKAPLRVVGAYRDTEVAPQDPLSIVLADLAHGGLAAQRTLAPLTTSEVCQLLEGLREDATVAKSTHWDRVVQRAGGVPFFVVSCAQGLRCDDGAGETADTIPWTLAQGLRQRVAALPEGARELLGVAAVIGRVAPRAVLFDLAGRPEGEVLAALDAACHARLLVEQEQGYAFAHDVIRELVEDDLGAARRTALHLRVLTALEALAENGRERHVDLLAYHSRQAGEGHKAAHYARLAGDCAVRMAAYREAIVQYEAALELLPADELQTRAELLDKLGEAAYPQGDTSVYLRHWQEAQQIYDQIGERRKAADLSRRLGRVAWERGETAAAFAYTRAAVAGLAGEPPGRELAMAYSALSQLQMLVDRPRESIEWGEKALVLAAELSDDAVRAHALNNMGCSLMLLGDLQRGREYLEQSLALAQGAGLVHDIMRACNNLGVRLFDLGEFIRAAEVLREGLAWIEQAGWESHRCKLLANLAEVEIELGYWERAQSLVRDLKDEEVAFPRARLLVASVQGKLLLRAGGPLGEAMSLLEEIQTAGEQEEDIITLRDTLFTLARVYLALGYADQAVQAMDRCSELWRTVGPLLGWEQTLGYGVEVYLRAGRAASARELLEGLLALGRRVDTALSRACMADAQGLVAAHEGRFGEAATHFEHATGLWQAMSCPYEEALAHRRQAESLLHAGDTAARTAAECELGVARAIFRRLGAPETAGMIGAL